MRPTWLFVPVLLATGVVLADDAPKTKPEAVAAEAQARTNEDPSLGMSVLGNQEAPKALVIVPWKSSEIGASLGIQTMLDDSKQPIDKEVFLRELSYYEIRSETDAAQPATAAHRR